MQARLLATLAFLTPVLLSACTGDETNQAARELEAAEEHAHCSSLLMRPGDLVYVQCRLALRQTYLENYAARRAGLEAETGVVSGAVDRALRNDAFCNYDESIQASLETPDPELAANTAYLACATTRDELAEAIATETGLDARRRMEGERAMVLEQNRAAVAEARAVVDGPPA